MHNINSYALPPVPVVTNNGGTVLLPYIDADTLQTMYIEMPLAEYLYFKEQEAMRFAVLQQQMQQQFLTNTPLYAPQGFQSVVTGQNNTNNGLTDKNRLGAAVLLFIIGLAGILFFFSKDSRTNRNVIGLEFNLPFELEIAAQTQQSNGTGTGFTSNGFTRTAAATVTNTATTHVKLTLSANGYNPVTEITSISPDIFADALRKAGSPAAPEAYSIYRVLNGKVDHAVALGFFFKESSYGKLGVANQSKSWGNIRCTSGYSCVSTNGNGSFRSYSTWTAGAADWVNLMYYYRDTLKKSTLEQILPTYAPAADNNNPPAYIKGVKDVADNLRALERQFRAKQS
jgi:hypothetical protein